MSFSGVIKFKPDIATIRRWTKSDVLFETCTSLAVPFWGMASESGGSPVYMGALYVIRLLKNDPEMFRTPKPQQGRKINICYMGAPLR